MVSFSSQPLIEITKELETSLQTSNIVSFEVINPDISDDLYSGEPIWVDGKKYLYRGYKAWVNLAELLGCKMQTPTKYQEHTIVITFQKLNTNDSFHTAPIDTKEEKYGVDSAFFSINKNEEPTFLHAYDSALKAVKIENRQNILDLGINKADEFELIASMMEPETFANINLTGIDHSSSAIKFAKNRFPNAKFYAHDINKLGELSLGRFDLIISIGTLQSPDINYKPFLMDLVQNYLTDNGALILGFPNSRWIGHELIYGAKAPNYNYSEMSLLFNDVIFAKKYLQQKKFRVTITGREYIFITATKIGTL
ncbi:MAG: methyltransferase domain-containing protein [Sulfurovaceae bacterium]|nr:methyltransferase domain-containing protein [Sulfurovaceae bacterium]